MPGTTPPTPSSVTGAGSELPAARERQAAESARPIVESRKAQRATLKR
jgi:hypothetical protein